MILIVDNYDSFTYNLAQIVGQYTRVRVLRNDDPTLRSIARQAAGIIFSPGPGRPEQAGMMPALIREFATQVPILGICLGHQAIGVVFGGTVTHAKQVRHGKISDMAMIAPSPLMIAEQTPVMRYHSLIIPADQMPKNFIITGIAIDDHEVMAMQHRDLPIFGYQFHPESIGTPAGTQMIRRFVALVIAQTGHH